MKAPVTAFLSLKSSISSSARLILVLASLITSAHVIETTAVEGGLGRAAQEERRTDALREHPPLFLKHLPRL